MTDFIECESLSISYNEMGIATITYTVVSDNSSIPSSVGNSISVGGLNFSGFITNLYQQPIPNTENWYTTNVTMVAVS